MFHHLLYFLIFLSSCILGAIVGLGGGVIIRPILDAVGYHDMPDIAFLTSTAVLIMAGVSTAKKASDGTVFDIKKAALICLGSLIGGSLGDFILLTPIDRFGQANVGAVQTVATIFFLIMAVYLTKKDNLRYDLKKMFLYLPLGIFLGTIAVFLGIGGGPINVPVFMILFSLKPKDATAYSIVVIFFSHLSRLISMGVSYPTGFGEFDLGFLPFIIPAAIVGGAIGAIISKKVSQDTVKKTFIVTMYVLIAINIFNLTMFVMSDGGYYAPIGELALGF